MNETAIASTVLMIRPAGFGANAETVASNRFQRKLQNSSGTRDEAKKEFDAAVAALTRAGVQVEVFDDTPEPHKPDAVFPNNWVSFHVDGTVCLYPMLAPNRRRERRADILDSLQHERGYRIEHIEDLSGAEQAGQYLEGTGSLVLDRLHRIAYACLSPRTDAELLHQWCEKFGYLPVVFQARDTDGAAIYHTNVMLCVGEGFAVACLDSFSDRRERDKVIQTLRDTGHDIVPIDMNQLAQFAGNMLLLRNHANERLLVMSRRAEQCLQPEQRTVLERFARIVSSPLDTIEDCAGGSMRCMIAELFLPRT